MKTLQNNFTTPEQSKRLLELGVPADSADCYWTEFPLYEGKFRGYEHKPQWLYDDESFSKLQSYCKTRILPCWSVGRLIEISRICSTLPEEEYMFPFWYDTQDNIEWTIRVIESGIITGNMDFSKLDD